MYFFPPETASLRAFEKDQFDMKVAIPYDYLYLRVISIHTELYIMCKSYPKGN